MVQGLSLCMPRHASVHLELLYVRVSSQWSIAVDYNGDDKGARCIAYSLSKYPRQRR